MNEQENKNTILETDLWQGGSQCETIESLKEWIAKKKIGCLNIKYYGVHYTYTNGDQVYHY